MKDRKGNELAVGDKVWVLPRTRFKEDQKHSGQTYVRAVTKHDVRVDDGKLEDTDICTSKSFHWSAWIEEPERLEKIS